MIDFSELDKLLGEAASGAVDDARRKDHDALRKEGTDGSSDSSGPADPADPSDEDGDAEK